MTKQGADPASVKEKWLNQALARAGIDASKWVPARGAIANRPIIEAVYTYYANLYLAHERLCWAGMAALVGPSFYAGFRDIDSVPGHLLMYFETTFLEMQRQIFEDQAVMHEAYLTDGIAGIRQLTHAGILDTATRTAWEQIDSGQAPLIHAGNRQLLYREQHDIVDHFYVSMHKHGGGEAFTYAITLGGRPSIPGAKPYAVVFPVTIDARVSRRLVRVTTPLANGNIAVFPDRWGLIEHDTFPAFLRFLENKPRSRKLIGKPIARRVGRFLLGARAGQLALGFVSRWRVQLTAQPSVQRPSRRSPPPASAVDATPLEINLTRLPTRADTGFTESNDYRAWARADHQPFPVVVSLPGGRSYVANAQLVTVASRTTVGQPGRVTVKLPPTSRDQARAALMSLTNVWDMDPKSVEEWYTQPHSASRGHAYSTRVFPAQPVGFVVPEFQVEHYVQTDQYVVDALFTWEVSASPGESTSQSG